MKKSKKVNPRKKPARISKKCCKKSMILCGRVALKNNSKKEYLSRYRFANNTINRLLEERDRVWAMLTKITQSYSEKTGTGDGDKICVGVSRLAELEKEINDEIDKYVDLRNEIVAYIEEIQDEKLIAVLKYRYIDGLKWSRIALEMHYERETVCRLHGVALAKLREI